MRRKSAWRLRIAYKGSPKHQLIMKYSILFRTSRAVPAQGYTFGWTPGRQVTGLILFGLMMAITLAAGQLGVPAATITVSDLGDSGPGTLRQAVADAAPGDTIDFS